MPQIFESSVAKKIRQLYQIAGELEQLFPGRHYTPDGHMIGSIGEALAAVYYQLTLLPAGTKTHDAVAEDGRLVQIKATQIDRIALSSCPQWLLVIQIHSDGSFSEEYNGPGVMVWNNCWKIQKTGQRQISLSKLHQLYQAVPMQDRLKSLK